MLAQFFTNNTHNIAGENIYPCAARTRCPNHYVHIVRIKSCFLIRHRSIWYVILCHSKIIMLLVLSIQFTQMIHLIDSVWILPWSLIINVLINFLLAQVRMSYESFINIQLNTHKNLPSHPCQQRWYWWMTVK